MSDTPILQQHTIHDIKQMIKNQHVHNLLIQQIQQIFPDMLSVIVIYQKLFIKFKHKPTVNALHVNEFDSSLYMIKINRSFPLENSVRLYLLNGCYQPKIFDTRDLIYEVLGQAWNYDHRLKDIIDKIAIFQQKMAKRNENYLALQRTGLFLLGDLFVYNQLQEHTSLTLFVDKHNQNNQIMNAVSQTHLFTFQKATKKVFKSRQEEEYEMKSKTLYGKKFVLTKFCDLQCIQSMQICFQSKQITMNILKYRSIKFFSDFDGSIRKITFNDDESMKLFIRIVLKNLPKYQPTRITFLPFHQKGSAQFKEDSAIHKVIQMNELENKLEVLCQGKKFNQQGKKQEITTRLNKSYQKMIEYYSARANPYYLIYVSKLNWLYQKYFVNSIGKTKQNTDSFKQSVKSDKIIDEVKIQDNHQKQHHNRSKSVQNHTHQY